MQMAYLGRRQGPTLQPSGERKAAHRAFQTHFFPPLLGGTSDKDFHIWVRWLYSAMLLTVLSLSRQGYCPVHSSSPLFGEELKVLSFLDLIVSLMKQFLSIAFVQQTLSDAEQNKMAPRIS